MRGSRNPMLGAEYLMQHETLTMQENADPFRFPMNQGICHLNTFHMSLVAPVSEVLVDCKVVKVVCAFKALDSGFQGVEFRGTNPPGSFVL